jgi:hypothetical protein
VTVSGAEITSWLLQTAIAAGSATTAFFVLLPTKFGERYLSFHFDRKLADLKDTQNQKIESLKEQLNHLGDRGKRSNEREYEALSDIWSLFVDAFDSTELGWWGCRANSNPRPGRPRLVHISMLATQQRRQYLVANE